MQLICITSFLNRHQTVTESYYFVPVQYLNGLNRTPTKPTERLKLKKGGMYRNQVHC